MSVGEEHRLWPDPASKELETSWDQKGAVGHHKELRQSPGSVSWAPGADTPAQGYLNEVKALALEHGLCLWVLWAHTRSALLLSPDEGDGFFPGSKEVVNLGCDLVSFPFC